MCNQSFHSGSFPSSLKMSVITPVVKKQGLDTDEMKNFRPVSNIKVISKLVESAAATRLMKHLNGITFFHPHQSAYRKFHSTETAILQVTDTWRRSIDNGRCVCIASLDVTAAFDSVNHEILLSRLKNAGVVGKAIEWFQSYLDGRTAVVKCRDARSNLSPSPVESPKDRYLVHVYSTVTWLTLHGNLMLFLRMVCTSISMLMMSCSMWMRN
jgi:hypothetical protein